MAKPQAITVTRERLHQILDYNSETGIFTRLIAPLRIPSLRGKIAGSIYSNGYRYIAIDGTYYRANRLAWFYVYGDPIPDEIDHKNMVKSDDRIDNLRASTTSQNQANRLASSNNTSGVKGVHLDRGMWMATITVNGVARNLGRYRTRESAAAVYAKAASEAFGEFSKTG